MTDIIKHNQGISLKQQQVGKHMTLRQLQHSKQSSKIGTLIIGDISGSMRGRKLDALQKAMRDCYKPGIKLYVFSDDVFELSAQDIDALRTDGGTQMLHALREGWNAEPKHIVLITDGKTTDAEPFEIINEAKAHKCVIDTIGISDGTRSSYDYDPEFLRALAEATGGRFMTCDEPLQLSMIVQQLLLNHGAASPSGSIIL